MKCLPSKHYVLIIFLSLFTSCVEQTPEKPPEKMSLLERQRYERDSLYITHTIWELIRQNYYLYSGYDTFDVPVEEVSIYCDTIYYSPDDLKFVSMIITKNPNNEGASNRVNPDKGYYFSGKAFAGVRDSMNSPWSIYPLLHYRPTLWDTYESLSTLLRKHYQEDLKNTQRWVLKGNQQKVLEYFGSNLGDPEFWDDNLLWRKGVRLPGLYIFQTTENRELPYKRLPSEKVYTKVVYPELIYPDSLLVRFRN